MDDDDDDDDEGYDSSNEVLFTVIITPYYNYYPIRCTVPNYTESYVGKYVRTYVLYNIFSFFI